MRSRARLMCAAFAIVIAACGCVAHQLPAFDLSHIDDLPCRAVVTPADPPPRWTTTRDAAELSRLARWCETVGPVLFQPRAASDTGQPIDRLAIVSWNVHEGGGDVDDLMQRLRGGEFTGGEPIDHFVLLLQEATRRDGSVPPRVARGSPVPRAISSHPPSRNADVQRFADRGYALLYAPSMRNGPGPEDRGNAIVSTLQLADARLIELPLEHQRRVSVAAAVEGRTTGGRSWRLDLVNVHLDTALALGRGGPFAARRRQAAALLDALRSSPRQSDGRQAFVVAGDFNTWMGDREAVVRMLSDAFPDAPAADPGPTWLGPLGLHATLDHVFVRGAVSASRVTRLPSRFGSDHFPLLTVIRF